MSFERRRRGYAMRDVCALTTLGELKWRKRWLAERAQLWADGTTETDAEDAERQEEKQKEEEQVRKLVRSGDWLREHECMAILLQVGPEPDEIGPLVQWLVEIRVQVNALPRYESLEEEDDAVSNGTDYFLDWLDREERRIESGNA